MASKFGTLAEAFESKFVRGGADECWNWLAYRDRKGYGGLSFEGRSRIASRVSYELHHGPIPTGLLVLHSCDNPPCVNPNHLWVGTHGDNARDAVEKGRWTQTKVRERCKAGHIRTEVRKPCRECQRAYNATYSASHAESKRKSDNDRRRRRRRGEDTSPRDRTHCPKGHEYSGDNVRFSRLGVKECRACDRERKKRR